MLFRLLMNFFVEASLYRVEAEISKIELFALTNFGCPWKSHPFFFVVLQVKFWIFRKSRVLDFRKKIDINHVNYSRLTWWLLRKVGSSLLRLSDSLYLHTHSKSSSFSHSRAHDIIELILSQKLHSSCKNKFDPHPFTYQNTVRNCSRLAYKYRGVDHRKRGIFHRR